MRLLARLRARAPRRLLGLCALLLVLAGGLAGGATLLAPEAPLRTIALAPAAAGDIALDPASHRAVIAGLAAAATGGRTIPLTVLDTRSGDVLRTLSVGYHLLGAVLLTPHSHRLIVLDTVTPNGQGTAVRFFDAQSWALLRVTPVALGPFAAAVDERSGHVFVASTGRLKPDASPVGPGQVSMLDARTGALLRTVTVGRDPFAVAVAGAAGHVFVAQYTSGAVAMLSARTGALLRTVRVGRQPVALAIDNRTGLVFVANEGSSTVSVLSARTGAVRRTLATGYPLALAVDQTSGHLLVAASPLGQPAALNTFDERTGARLARVVVGGSPVAIAVDERTHRAFVASTQLDRNLYEPLRRLFQSGLSWAGEYNDNGTSVFDTRRGTLIRTIQTGPASHNGVAVDAGSGHAFVVVPQQHSVRMLDATR